MKEVQLGQVGLQLAIWVKSNRAVLDISGATVKKMHITDPKQVSTDYTAQFVSDGHDGGMCYITTGSSILLPGTWQMQGYLELPEGKEGYTTIVKFSVIGNLPNPPSA